MSSHPALLPNGLVDLLPPQAEAEARTIELFMKEFGAYGYNRVKPPLVEFEESLLGQGPGKKLARNTFRLMDPVSQMMMGVRADVTAQIARISQSRLADAPRPLRLSYAADVLRVNGTQLRPERQFSQVGCELIGVDTIIADVELALIALKALSAAGIKGLSIDLTLPTLIQNIYDAANMSDADRARFDAHIEKRDRDALANEQGDVATLIVALLEAEGTAERSIPLLSNLKLTGAASDDIVKLMTVAKDLRDAVDVYGLEDVQITIDPLERRGFEYQTGVSFTLFAKSASGELGRGGRYDVQVDGKPSETATGFTLYMDSILRVIGPQAAPAAHEVEAAADWKSVKLLQDKGFMVIRKG
jgi:ATP phosphoribosyltransferase regulatory subunit